MPFWKKQGESVDWLDTVGFFEGFSHDELVRVHDLSTEVEAEQGALLCDQGDTGLDCFVIVDGSASVYVGGDHVATLPAGSMVGEMALVDHRPRTASVVADTAMRLLRFDARHFRKLLDEMPKASERVMRLLTERSKRNA
jgi:CRP-like cAMP-binding protein